MRSYVTRLGDRYAPLSLKLIATAVRSFLRYAWVSGWTAGDLTGAVGPVITHRSGRLPRALAAEDLRRLLASPDCRTTTGLRDHALLVLLSRLGLRAGEAAGLCLDDFDWRAATVVARVKGGGRLRLPIPADVGPVVVAYLQRRPADATCREVFVQVRGEPKPMTGRAVTQVVARHAARAGLGTVRAHRLRHSAARAVLVAGGNLSEVGTARPGQRPGEHGLRLVRPAVAGGAGPAMADSRWRPAMSELSGLISEYLAFREARGFQPNRKLDVCSASSPRPCPRTVSTADCSPRARRWPGRTRPSGRLRRG